VSGPDDSEPVPRLPRSRGLALDRAAIFRIAMTLALLVMIIVSQRPCADAVSTFVTDFDNTGSGAAARQMPKPGTVDVPADPGSASDYERITPDMTPEQIQQAIERAKARARGEAADASGSAATGAGSSSAAGSGAPTGSADR